MHGQIWCIFSTMLEMLNFLIITLITIMHIGGKGWVIYLTMNNFGNVFSHITLIRVRGLILLPWILSPLFFLFFLFIMSTRINCIQILRKYIRKVLCDSLLSAAKGKCNQAKFPNLMGRNTK